MEEGAVQVGSETVELDGGQVLLLQRFAAEDGRSVVVLRRGFPDELNVIPKLGDQALGIPDYAVGDLIEALRKLDREST